VSANDLIVNIPSAHGTTFQVFGDPASQGSKSVINGHTVEGRSTGQRAKLRSWRTAVAEAASTAWDGPPIDGPVSLSVRFVLRRPSGARKGDRWQAKRPDIDKLLRSTLDGLVSSGVIVDDSRIACLTATKTLAYPDRPWTGAQITITPLRHEVSP
jgi:crossover junction endodeoxyribonuclease RusA